MIAMALGWGTEEHLQNSDFRPGGFLQSLGTVVAASVVLGDRNGIVTGLWAFVIGFVTLIAGFYFAFA
jgi:hypothetical protein